ncbi:hypothetical protein BH11ACT3_BH11ACT3_13560 [soil metagenome]
MGRRGGIRAALAVAGAAMLVMTGAGAPAVAAPAAIGAFPVWTQTASTDFTGRLPASAGGGVIAVHTDAVNARVAESGTQAFLGAQTGFGQRFGTSRYQSYLTFGLAPASAPSTTTISLPTLAAGWGFALGDIDADMVTIAASDGGAGLTPAQLGAQDTAGTPYLNYCRNASPKPSGCSGAGPFDDFPFWCPDAASGAVCAGLPAFPTVVGQLADTYGAYDWFVPTVPVDTLTLTFRPQSGSPIFQLWIVAPASASTVSGAVTLDSGGPAPAGTTLALEQNGAPVLDVEAKPVIVPVAADGTFSFDTIDGDYELELLPPPGFADADPRVFPLAFTAAGGAVGLGTLRLTTLLAATGAVDVVPHLQLAVALVAAGLVLQLARFRNEKPRHRLRASPRRG